MQCGALILCFAAPAPVIDDSYHVCRPSIDFFSFSFFPTNARESCGTFLLFHRAAGFKSCSVFSQIASGGLQYSSRAFKSNFAHAAALMLRARGSFGYSRAGAHCVFFDPVSVEMFLLRRESEREKIEAKEIQQGFLSCLKLYFGGMFWGKIKVFFFHAPLHEEMAWKFRYRG